MAICTGIAIIFILSVSLAEEKLTSQTGDFSGPIKVHWAFLWMRAVKKSGKNPFDCFIDCAIANNCKGVVPRGVKYGCDIVFDSIDSRNETLNDQGAYQFYRDLGTGNFCPGFVWGRQHSRYLVTKSAFTWTEAVAHCKSLKARLTNIVDRQELKHISNIQKEIRRQFIVGARNTGNGWRWSPANGNASEIWDWAGLRAPNRTGMVVVDSDGSLKAISESERRPAICECYHFVHV